MQPRPEQLPLSRHRAAPRHKTLTDENGHYLLANIRAGEVRVTAYGEGQNSKNQVIQLAENEARTVDFNFERHEGGIEGYFTINGKPGTGLVRATAGEEAKDNFIGEGLTDGRGYFRIANLAPGKYTVQLQHFGSHNEGKRIMPESVVEVAAGELARCDFALEAGGIEGIVRGLGPDERAGVGVFPGIPDPSTVADMAASGIEALMTTYMETPNSGEFRFDDIPPGTYSLGVIALPAAREGTDPESMEPHVLSALAAGRYAIQSVEVAAGEPAKVEVTLPR